jgi:hypothetical protein
VIRCVDCWEQVMNCAMCPSWMGGGLVLGSVIGLLFVVLLVVVIAKLIRS